MNEIMHKLFRLSFLAFIQCAIAHGGHEHSGPAEGETIQQYAQRHMSSEHHIDTFDTRSFFQLHDLDRNGVWDKEEIEAVYGVHHVYSQKLSKDDEEHQKKAEHIVKTVLEHIDLNKDGLVSPEELEKVGLDGLPNFDGLGAEGHHYDVESEFFLHHEEKYHNTPETQTDESYVHPEDLEHFAHHEHIEHDEAEREAKFQGISMEEVLRQQHEAADAAAAADKVPPSPKPIVRTPPPEAQDPEIKFQHAQSEGAKKGEWGTGEAGYKPPKDAGDKLRKNLPYKYKFRRNWGDF
ncbi:hypothetical protein CPB83DRAFT_861855 [Crepidotus variabilis]|uniref:EF-hand domain-containing protein n=1 Tax=Crepidotus variabilis TaxID=179855 RepID=A0A9P6E808_9AGAR|nr:hypothetical protein CPB83DRAFT_861855 [Crepidotus variabilis]